MATATRVELTERGTTPARLPAARRYLARIIEGNRQGSSGYYSAEMLTRDGPSVFHEGLHLYLDHPTHSELADRPERSVRDLAARLATAAAYQEAGPDGPGLYAEVEVYPHIAPIIDAMAPDIGLSIRAYGTAEASTDPAIPGPIVTSLTGAHSVDFVTAAGAGGKLVALLESARAGRELVEARNIGAWLEARLHLAFTELTDGMYGDGRLTREERIALSGGIGDALKSFVSRVEADAPQLFARDLWAELGPVAAAVTESALPTTQKEGTVAEPTTQTGAPPAGGSPSTTPELTEAERGRVTALEAEIATLREAAALRADHAVRADRAERDLTEARATITRLQGAETARSQVAAAFAESGLPAPCLATVTAQVVGLNGQNLALTEAGALDMDRLTAAISAALLAERTQVASIAEALGYGGAVRGMGAAPAGSEQSPAQFEEALAASLARLPGMDDKTAAAAAKGR